jgi:CO/xanthine dehydrogenase FAD-binding subunit
MRGNAEAHVLASASDLSDVLRRLEAEPGIWTPIAGGTELMVAHAAGRLSATKLINLWGLPELNVLQADEDSLSIGAGVTFGLLRRDPIVLADFPLLARAASWIGAIANQNRATIGGNIVNGSPAADAPPALLVYDAEIELISLRGKRRIPYAEFHLGYKRNVLQPDELVFALHLPRRFSKHAQYLRKVGARNAMAITKVALAATAIVAENRIGELRLAAASVADRPVRLLATEAVLHNNLLSQELFQQARACLLDEVRPIDDIRSTADYRRQVAANLLGEFLSQLQTQQQREASS